jgi:hypothetical protein
MVKFQDMHELLMSPEDEFFKVLSILFSCTILYFLLFPTLVSSISSYNQDRLKVKLRPGSSSVTQAIKGLIGVWMSSR